MRMLLVLFTDVPSSTVNGSGQFISAVRTQSVLGWSFTLLQFPTDTLCNYAVPWCHFSRALLLLHRPSTPIQ
jgi:hypothetical protein